MRVQLEPRLYTALNISALPKISPSDEFREKSKVRLMARLYAESALNEAVKPSQRLGNADDLVGVWQRLLGGIARAKRVAVPAAVSVLLAISAVLFMFGSFNLLAPSPALASQCTLSVLNSNVEVQNPGADIWQKGVDGMVLEAGARVRTATDAHAMLTFFEGSTIRLEPNTDIEVQQIEHIEVQSTTIILKQWVGRTWSRVVKMTGPGSHYEIRTPSAYALVRGTLFMTEVDEGGATTVQTVEGLVAVGAQTAVLNEFDMPNEEVDVPAGYETYVGYGATPSEPTPAEAPVQIQGESTVQDRPNAKGNGPDSNNGKAPQDGKIPPGQSEEGPPGQSDKDKGQGGNQDNGNATGQDNANATGQDNANATGQDKGGDKGNKGGDKGNKGGDKGNDKGGDKGNKGGDKGNDKGVALGDVNGDGNLDAFVINYNQPNKVWLNNGSGTFTDSGQSSGTLRGMRVALGDVDGDGDLDAFVANDGANKVWRNKGSDKGNKGSDKGNDKGGRTRAAVKRNRN